jgi:endo-1,4-beta-xylanase
MSFFNHAVHPGDEVRTEVKSFRVGAGLATGALLLACAFPVAAQTVVSNDFEDGTLQGWIPRGGVALANSTDVAHGGTHSLLTTGRTVGYMGPSLNILGTLTKGATYQVTAWVRLVAGTAATQLKITVQRTPVGGSAAYDTVVSSAATGVTDAAWVQLTGAYSYTTDSSGLLLYVESASTTASYYVDDFSITQVAPSPGPPGNTTGFTSTFESNTPEGWVRRIGSETLTVTNADAHGGIYSLLTSGRTATYAGPAIDVHNVIFNGSRYQVSVWAKLAPGEASTQLRVSIQRNLGTLPASYTTVVPNTTVTNAGWVQLSATFDSSFANSSLTLYVESASGTPSFYIDDFQISYVPPIQIQPNLVSVYQALSPYFPIGAAVNASTIAGVHGTLLTKHFNSITSENDTKWDASEPTEGNFNFTNSDAQLNFAIANHMIMRGHTLVWHQQTPAWVFLDAGGAAMTPTPENKALLLQRLRNHIQGVAGHFGSSFYAWDVVNEAIDSSQPDCMRRSNWYNITGKDFIDVAFQTARQVVPNVKLYYNDYSTTDSAKRTCIYNLVADLKSRGIPIDGVGHQMHINLNYPGAQAVIDTVNQLATLGIDQQLTEMDISVGSTYTNYSSIPTEVLAEEGYRYRDYFNALRPLRGLVSSVTLWGMADDHTWLTNGTKVDAPLLFDQGLQAKPAYWGIVDSTQLPGSSLTGSIAAKTGPTNARVWTIALSNPGPGTATSAQITGFTLTQTSGAACTPIVTPPGAYPISLGDIPAGGSAGAAFTIDFTGCAALARFGLNVPFAATLGANTGAVIRNNQYR